MFTNLVLSGGAVKGFCFIGVVRYLEEIGLISNINTLVGSSAGSIICFLIALGFASDRMYSTCFSLLRTYLSRPLDLDALINLNITLGIDDGSCIVEWLSASLFEIYGVCDMNFIDFAKKTGKNLVVCASSLTERKPHYFSVETTPTCSVITAIRASITIPYLFTPQEIDGHIYVDAGLFNNFPIDYITNFVLKDTLGVVIESKGFEPVGPLSILSYARLMIDTMLERINLKSNEALKGIVMISIEDKSTQALDFDMNTLKLNVDQDLIVTFYEKGLMHARSVLTKPSA